MKIILAALFLMTCAGVFGNTAFAADAPVLPIPSRADAAAVRALRQQEMEKVACSHRIVMGKGPTGALEAICLGADDLASLYAQDATGAWRAHGPLADPGRSPLRALATFPGQDPLKQVVALGRDDGLPRILTRTPQGGWGAPELLPTGVSAPYAALAPCFAPDGSQQVIALGRKDGLPYLMANDAAKGRWFFIGAIDTPRMPYGALTVGAHGVGQVPLVLIGRDNGQLFIITQRKDGRWDDFHSLPNFQHTPMSTTALVMGSDGYRQLLCIGRDDGQPYLIWQDAVTGGWNFYGAMANPQHTWLSLVATGLGKDGMLQAICLGRDDGLPHHLGHSLNGKWSPVAGFPATPGAPFSALATGNNGGGLQVVCLGRTDGQPYLFIQDQATGAWTAAGKLTTATVAPVPIPVPEGGKAKRDDF